ncbi:MAG TPA: hypothetical protein VK146_10300 [Tabrizicola sp.]|nr:hypothetical protein [Tabrizicola sp.]
MEVSHFELVWKLQSPATPIGQTGIDKVFQGYFLELTNLESTAFTYAVEFVVAPGAPPERNLTGNTVVFVDTPGTNNAPGVLNGNAAGTVFSPSTGTITVQPGATALVAVLPSAFPAGPLDQTPLVGQNFEVRGYVRLRLPTVFRLVPRPNGGFTFRRVAQSANPVRVMLTPQNRAVYYAQDGSVSDQTQSSLPTASGMAVNALAPDQPFIFPTFPVELDLNRLERMTALIPEEDQSLMLAGLLASIDAEAMDLSGMNAAMSQAGVGLAIEKRKIKV